MQRPAKAAPSSAVAWRYLVPCRGRRRQWNAGVLTEREGSGLQDSDMHFLHEGLWSPAFLGEWRPSATQTGFVL